MINHDAHPRAIKYSVIAAPTDHSTRSHLVIIDPPYLAFPKTRDAVSAVCDGTSVRLIRRVTRRHVCTRSKLGSFESNEPSRAAGRRGGHSEPLTRTCAARDPVVTGALATLSSSGASSIARSIQSSHHHAAWSVGSCRVALDLSYLVCGLRFTGIPSHVRRPLSAVARAPRS